MDGTAHPRAKNVSSIALIACAGIIVGASWLLAGAQLYADYRSRIAEGLRNIGNLADVLSQHTTSNLDIAAQSLLGLSTTIAIERLDDPASAAQIHDLLNRRQIATRSVLSFTITDENGIVRHTSTNPSPEAFDMSPLPFYPAIKNSKLGELYFASASIGRFGPLKDLLMFSISTRLEDKAGAFKGGVHATILLETFGKTFRAITVGPNSIVGMVHSDGTLMIRHPDPDGFTGRNYADLPAVRTMLDDADGVGMAELPYSTGWRYQTYRKLNGYPFVIYVAAAKQDILAPWRDSVIAAAIGQSALTMLIGLLTVLVRNALQRRTAAEAENLRLLHEARAHAAEAGRARDEMAQVFAATSDGIVTFDRNLVYLMVNESFARIVGSPRESFIGKSIYERVVKGASIISHLEKCLATGLPVEYENEFKRADGKKVWVEVRLFPIRDQISVYVRDVSERRIADQKLLESQRMDAVGRLAGGLAHDFNNMLSVIVGNVEILLDKLSDANQRRSIEMVRAAAVRGSDMVSRLLSFARRQPLDPKPINVATVIKEAQSLLRRSLPENIALEFVQGAGLWQATADAAQLDNALVNLVMNARDAMPDGGKITIEATNAHLDHAYATQADVSPGQYVQIAVSDTGTGMPADVAVRAFEPFFTTKDVGKGTGLGLSMVYGFAKQSGGHVRLYSETGHGTTVKMYLPRAAGISDEAATSTAMPTAPRGTETILMVEDNDMVREFVETLLTDLGYNVIACPDADKALRQIQDGLKPDLLLSDIVLTGPMNGRQLAEKIKETLPGLPVLYMSGYAENAVVHHGRLDPGVQLITKPFRRYDIATRLRAVLGNRS
ncbi:MAG: response regulator [Rhodospirillaceae bacterium]|nr:response regulator [Rhodospirillaceae bacterium]